MSGAVHARALASMAWALALAGLMAAAQAADPASGAATAFEARTDAQWLLAIQSAAGRQNYTGTIIYQRGDDMRASRVIHYFDGNDAQERVLTLDGQQREFIRHGDEVQCLYPRLHRIVIEHGAARPGFPALAQAGPAEVLEHYELHRGGLERVAGSTCQLLTLVPLDHFRYGYRLWVEPSSGLLLKVQTLNDRNEVVEQIAFSDVRIGEQIDPAQLKPSWPTAGWSVDRQAAREIELKQQGWSVTAPSGFRRLIEVVRNKLIGSRDAEHPTLQAVYSDGLATVSVFIEPGAPPLGVAEESQRRGSLSAITRSVGDARVTVVGEVPPSTARSIAESVVRSDQTK
ncbi:MAG TPA: MucB/RseB C-terminal domain-containing protein [Burkholderiaceae bacterium]